MAARTVTVTLPEPLYSQIEAQARRAARPVDEVVAHAIARGLIAATDPELPPAVQAELAGMEVLADEVLWEVAASTVSPDTVALYDVLVERQQDGQLTAQGQRWLERIRTETELLMVRKAHAYALLKQRGHHLPALEGLPSPTP